jgi:hypothetical protein
MPETTPDTPQWQARRLPEEVEQAMAHGRNLEEDELLMKLIKQTMMDHNAAQLAMARIRQQRIYQSCLELDKHVTPGGRFRYRLSIDPYLLHLWQIRYGREIFNDDKELARFMRDTPELRRPNLAKREVFQGFGAGRRGGRWGLHNPGTATAETPASAPATATAPDPALARKREIEQRWEKARAR